MLAIFSIFYLTHKKGTFLFLKKKGTFQIGFCPVRKDLNFFFFFFLCFWHFGEDNRNNVTALAYFSNLLCKHLTWRKKKSPTGFKWMAVVLSSQCNGCTRKFFVGKSLILMHAYRDFVLLQRHAYVGLLQSLFLCIYFKFSVLVFHCWQKHIIFRSKTIYIYIYILR